MNKTFFSCSIGALFLLTAIACNDRSKSGAAAGPSFAAARKAFTTKLVRQSGAKGDVEAPPAGEFSIVAYPTAIGKMAAYLSTIPDDGKLHPAMIWVTGGFGNDIGDVWSEQEPDNDQSAAVIRNAGIVMMYPSQRGGNHNPGADETRFGEVDDILAAADFLSKQKGVDPGRIYLGGHSTGGTKALLAAEASNQFRAVFSLGPAAAVKDYGEEHFTFDAGNEKEFELREPVRWLSSIKTPVYVFEGSTGNIDALKELRRRAEKEGDKLTHFYEVKGKDHFSEIQPVSKIIAQKIVADDKGGAVSMDFEPDVAAIR